MAKENMKICAILKATKNCQSIFKEKKKNHNKIMLLAN